MLCDMTPGVEALAMVEGLDDTFTGALFLGYHARASTPGVMSHSMIFGVRHFYINDRPVGELGLNAQNWPVRRCERLDFVLVLQGKRGFFCQQPSGFRRGQALHCGP